MVIVPLKGKIILKLNLYYLGGNNFLLKVTLGFVNKGMINCKLIIIVFIVSIIENLCVTHNKRSFVEIKKH